MPIPNEDHLRTVYDSMLPTKEQIAQAVETWRRTVERLNASVTPPDPAPSWDRINLVQHCIDCGDMTAREGWAVLYPKAAELADNSPWGFWHER
jgi:hypothetical protein